MAVITRDNRSLSPMARRAIEAIVAVARKLGEEAERIVARQRLSR